MFDPRTCNPVHRTDEQNKFAKQCQHSFNMLAPGTLQFEEDYWQGCMLNATETRIDHFIEVYSSESHVVFRRKVDTDIGAVKPFEHEHLLSSMSFDSKSAPKGIYQRTEYTVILQCNRMDDPKKQYEAKLAQNSTAESVQKSMTRKATGYRGKKCKATLRIKVIGLYSDESCQVSVGQRVGLLSDHLPHRHTHKLDWNNRCTAQLPRWVKNKGEFLFKTYNISCALWLKQMHKYCMFDLRNEVEVETGWKPDKNVCYTSS